MREVSQPIATSPSRAHDHNTYENCVAKLKHMAGLPGGMRKSIRESIRDNTFPRDLQDAIGCNLLENWSLRAQIQFLDSLAGLSDAEKSVRIHEVAYGLYWQRNLTGE